MSLLFWFIELYLVCCLACLQYYELRDYIALDLSASRVLYSKWYIYVVGFY